LDVAAGETLWTFASGGSCLSGAAISEERLSGARVTRSSAPRTTSSTPSTCRAIALGPLWPVGLQLSRPEHPSTPERPRRPIASRGWFGGGENPRALRIAAFSKPRPSGRVDALSTPGIPADPTETGTECGVLPPLLDLVRDPWDDGCCASRLADLFASTPVTTPSVRVAAAGSTHAWSCAAPMLRRRARGAMSGRSMRALPSG
jgi:hypothetical protein